MTDDDMKKIVDIMKMISDGGSFLEKDIRYLKGLIWDKVDVKIENSFEGRLYDLAYDLEFYRPGKGLRGEGKEYFGDRQVKLDVGVILSEFDM